jgi:cell wall-associated NlpC family hydrolase
VDIGELLDDGANGVAHALAVAILVVVVLLGVAVLVPIVVVTGMTGSATSAASAILSSPAQSASGRQSTTNTPTNPDLPPPSGSRPVEVARHFLGVRYVFGGSNPDIGLDCSGLVQVVFGQLGVHLPRTAQLQYNRTARITRDQLQPGDLVFFARTYSDPNDWITHVGIYIGEGLQINAPTEGQVVSIQPVFTGFWGTHFAGGGRIAAG